MLKWRPELPFLVLVPLIVAAAGVLSYYTWETATRFEELGASSIAHSTLLLVEEKVDRIEQQIISRDNAVFHLIDVADPEGLRSRWLPLAERVSPSVRAVLIFTPDLEVVDYVARAAQSEQRAFLKLFRKSIAPEIDMNDLELGPAAPPAHDGSRYELPDLVHGDAARGADVHRRGAPRHRLHRARRVPAPVRQRGSARLLQHRRRGRRGASTATAWPRYPTTWWACAFPPPSTAGACRSPPRTRRCWSSRRASARSTRPR